MIEFIILGNPKPKGRPRFFRKGNFVGTYTPDETRSYEANVVVQSERYRPERPWDCPIELTLGFYLQPPQYLAKHKTRRLLVESEELPVSAKPDIDNLVKSVVDALNGIFWQDDKLIYKLSVGKFYSFNPRTVVSVKKKGEDSCESPPTNYSQCRHQI